MKTMNKFLDCKNCINNTENAGYTTICINCHKESMCTYPTAFSKKMYDDEKKSIVYEYRQKGVDFCKTEGSDHYKKIEIEPMDIINQEGFMESFCLANIIKYAMRYKKDGCNKNDLKKIADYAHILCGYQLTMEDKNDGKEIR